MKVFVSWAGESSKAVALALRKVLPNMLQELDVFVSEHDIPSGSRWAMQLAARLQHTNFGIFCLTPESLTSQWLVFEAGALTKLEEGRACGLLHGLSLSDVTGPLAQFQHKPLEPEPFEALLQDLNKLLEKRLDPASITQIHQKWWPDLAEALRNIPPEETTPKAVQRSTPEILEELVARVRNVERRVEGQQAPEIRAGTSFANEWLNKVRQAADDVGRMRNAMMNLSAAEQRLFAACYASSRGIRADAVDAKEVAMLNKLVENGLVDLSTGTAQVPMLVRHLADAVFESAPFRPEPPAADLEEPKR
jgi:hypothetical protein